MSDTEKAVSSAKNPPADHSATDTPTQDCDTNNTTSNADLKMGTAASEETDNNHDGVSALDVQNAVPAVDRLPKQVYIVALAGAAERFAYYAMTAPLQNYMQNPRTGSANPGALDLGQQTATNISNAFLLLQFVAPMIWATVADLRLGRMKTLLISLAFWQVGCLILFVTSLPVALDHGAGLPGLIVALLLSGLGIAGVKATMPPLLVDQYKRTEPVVLKVGKDGKTYVSDRQLTIQFITNMNFWLVNIASLSMLPSTFIEKKVDFWASNLMALIFATLSLGLYLWYRKSLTILEPEPSAVPLAVKALWCAVRNGFSITAASPENQRQKHGKEVAWDHTTLDDVTKTLVIVRILIFSCPFLLAYIQLMNNLISQAGQMKLDGLPNDTMQVFNPVACIILGPVIQRGLFPLLRRMGLNFRAIARVTAAMCLMAMAIGYAAGLQHLIYSRGPCYEYPLACPEAVGPDGKVMGNFISVWIQTPVWLISATSEIFGFATIAEIAYELAPKSMKSLVQAVTQLTGGMATLIGIALSPLTKDPTLVILYGVIAGITFASSALFWLFFRNLDQEKKAEPSSEST